MPPINRTVSVPYRAEQMYQLITDIAAYPIFLPGCVASRVLTQQGNRIIAALTVAKAGICKTLITQNTLIPHRGITLQLLKGPFRQLSGGWQLVPISDQACQITLDLQFEFHSHGLDQIFCHLFKELTSSMVLAFSQRAAVLYGR